MARLPFGLGFGLSAVTCGVAVAGTVLSGSPAKAQFLYGADAGGVNAAIFETNILTRTTTFLMPTGGGNANALANDRVRNNLFFITPDNNLRVIQQGATSASLVSGGTAANLNITGLAQPQNAAFYDGAYWFFTRQATNVTPILNRITFSYTGNTPSFLNRQSFTLSNVPNGAADNDRNNYGDIAITSGGLLFAATNNQGNSTGRFFRLNLTNLDQTAINNSYIQLDADLGQGGLQTGFSSDYNTLYANGATTGNWFTINLTNGALTNFNRLPPNAGTQFNSGPFFDVSDSATLVRIPGPLPLLGAAAAFGWSRKLRKRVKAAVEANISG